jgi:mRNA interferase RelE/StbE
MSSYKLLILPSTQKNLEQLEKVQRKQIVSKIQSLQTNPRPHGYIKLKDVDAYRIRIGYYRIIYHIKDNELIVIIIKIGHRKDIYN